MTKMYSSGEYLKLLCRLVLADIAKLLTQSSCKDRPACSAQRLAYLNILYMLFSDGTITTAEVFKFGSAVIVSP